MENVETESPNLFVPLVTAGFPRLGWVIVPHGAKSLTQGCYGDMMSADGDARDAILLLVNTCNDYQTRNLALTSAFRALQLGSNVGEC